MKKTPMKFFAWVWFTVTLIKKEAVPGRCSIKKVFLKISQNSQENTCVEVSF